MQSTIPALVNDLANDHTRGRANSVNSGAFQLGAITGPMMAGFVLHDDRWVAFIAILIVGCGVVAASALGIERIVPPAVNGVRDRAAGQTRSRSPGAGPRPTGLQPDQRLPELNASGGHVIGSTATPCGVRAAPRPCR